MEVNGRFDVKRFYETLAMLLSNKYGVQINVSVQEVSEDTETLKTIA